MTEAPHGSSASMSNTAHTPSVAIIGMEGCGKTVLAATLAKRLSTIDSKGVFLNPQGVKTLKYVEGVWHTLQSGDWPPSTPPGELFELEWKLQVVGELECNVRLVDVPGQDIRLLFEEEQILSVESLPTRLQTLAEYCRSADIILFLINLKDFVGEGNRDQRTANEAAIKSAMDYLLRDGRPRRVCLVLTQADLYRELARQEGGWLELTAKAVPYVFNAHIQAHQAASRMHVYPVSAVADTQVVVDDSGTPRRVPTAGFRSEGLDDIVDWLTTHVREVKTELDKEAEAVAIELQAEQPPNFPPPVPSPDMPWSFDAILGYLREYSHRPLAFIAWGIAIIVVLCLLRGCIPGCGSKPPTIPRPEQPIRPIAEILKKGNKFDPGTFFDGLDVFGTVRNNGAAGKVRVFAKVFENDHEVEVQSKDFYLNPGEVANFSFDMDKLSSLKNKITYSCWAEVP